MSGDGGLTLTWLDGAEAMAAKEAAWAELCDRTGACVYQRPQWVLPWLRHFGAARDACALWAEAAGRPVGMLPFVIDRIGRFRVARLAGSDPHCIIFRPALTEETAIEVLAAAATRLLQDDGLDALSLTPLSDRSELARHLPDLAATGGIALHRKPEGIHIVFDLPQTHEAYLASLSKKRRAQLRRDQTNLTAAFRLTQTASTPDRAAFDAFVTFHNLQWQAVGKGGHFSDWPGAQAFYADLADAADTPVRFFSLEGDREPLATQFALISGRTAHWRLPARTLDPEAERLSIGKVGLVLMIKALIGQGITLIEAGRGHYGYKLSYGGQEVGVSRAILTADTPRARQRLKALLRQARLLDLLYYRVWFRRAVPWLAEYAGRAPRPLWTRWIRSRV